MGLLWSRQKATICRSFKKISLFPLLQPVQCPKGDLNLGETLLCRKQMVAICVETGLPCSESGIKEILFNCTMRVAPIFFKIAGTHRFLSNKRTIFVGLCWTRVVVNWAHLRRCYIYSYVSISSHPCVTYDSSIWSLMESKGILYSKV